MEGGVIMGYWQTMWIDDKKSMISVMYGNLHADLDAGYDPVGNSIKRQLETICDYVARYEHELMQLASMTDAQAERWCKFDLIRRGAIEV